MQSPKRLLGQTLASYALVVLLLASGMAFSIRRLDAVANEQIAHQRAQEQSITVVERLRWSGEAIVSAGRGYLFSGDAGLLTRLRRAEDDFDRGVLSLKRRRLGPDGADRIQAVEAASARFMAKQRELVAHRQQGFDSGALVRRFERELRPLQVELGSALDGLVGTIEGGLDELYANGTAARSQINAWMHALLTLLVLLSAGASWYFARALSRAFRHEHEALEEARRAVATRDGIMGIIAHDLRNPLGALDLRATLLARSDSERTRTHAARIQRTIGRMQHLIASMLELATLESGRLAVRPEACLARTLLDDASDLFDSLSVERRLTLRLEECPAPTCAVLADRARIDQVFSNLIGNALKFTPDGGTISIGARREEQNVRFFVTDSGPGIPREHLPHLFSRFWTFERNGAQGTGLGLFIAKGIVEGHGGRLWAQSEEGRGATFFFELPATARALEAVPDAPDEETEQDRRQSS